MGTWRTPPEADLDGTVSLVTGASRGIGRGIAHELGAAGATVYVTGRSTAVDRMTAGMAHELRGHGVVVVGLYPGFARTEWVLEAFGGAENVPEGTASPGYAGRAVAALAGDPGVLERSGGIYETGVLAREYGFTDVDGTQPEPFTFDGPRL